MFVALAETIRACSIPKEPFADLLTAFENTDHFDVVEQVDRDADLSQRTEQAAARGTYEQYKTTDRFDSTAHHPEWLGG